MSREDPPADRRAPGVGELPDLFLQLLLDLTDGAKFSPFALAEVGPAVVPEADDVDLGGLGPVLSDLEGGNQSLLAVEDGEGFPAEALEGVAELLEIVGEAPRVLAGLPGDPPAPWCVRRRSPSGSRSRG